MPRLGLYFKMPNTYHCVKWFGRGPHENYPDRKKSAHIGWYENSISDLYEPYISPQENGYRCDTRVLNIFDEKGNTIMISNHNPFGFSVLPFSPDQLTRKTRGALHTYDLKKEKMISVCIDHLMSGIGGIDSWGAKPLPKYRITAKKYEFEFRFSVQHKEGV